MSRCYNISQILYVCIRLRVRILSLLTDTDGSVIALINGVALQLITAVGWRSNSILLDLQLNKIKKKTMKTLTYLGKGRFEVTDKAKPVIFGV